VGCTHPLQLMHLSNLHCQRKSSAMRVFSAALTKETKWFGTSSFAITVHLFGKVS
jgi:hypothetical protein